MENQKFERNMKKTFDGEVPDVLSKIKASPDFRVEPKKRGFSINRLFTRKFVLSMMSVFVLALITVFAINGGISPVVASTITIDVNPSIQVELDKNDKVIRATAINDDGNDILFRIRKIRRYTLDEFLEKLITRLESKGYIVSTDDENNIVLIEVDSDDDAIRDRVKAKAETRIKNELSRFNKNGWVLNSKDIELTDDQMNQIKNDPRSHMYSRAKLSLVYRINNLDDSYKLKDLVEMTVRDLYDIYIQLEDPDKLPEFDKMPHHRNPPPGMN